MHETSSSSQMRTRSRRAAGLPWGRVLLGIATIGPALWIGGVSPWVLPVFAAVVLALWWRLCLRSNLPLRIPSLAVVLAVLAGATLLQALPIPGVRAWFAPALETMVVTALDTSHVAVRSGVSCSPFDTYFESARLVALAALLVAAAQMSWRASATCVCLAGLLVAVVGLSHEVLGLHKIYGIYAAHDTNLAKLPSLLGTFVNANHQSGLLLLGIFCGTGLALDQHLQRLTSRDVTRAEQYRDRALAALAAVLIQLPALVLSLSRGAMVALLLVGPVAAWLALRRSRIEKKADPRRGHPVGVRMLIVAGILVVVAIVAQHGAWRELSTLWAQDGRAHDNKLTMLSEAPALIEFSPVVGTGRGTFIDLFGTVEHTPTHVLSTHLESAPMAAVVEWGPVLGTLLLLAVCVWWARSFWGASDRRDRRARKVILLGLLAVGVQNLADFSLEFLGVAAPMAALIGACSDAPKLRLRVTWARLGGTAALLGTIALAMWAGPHTWSQRRAPTTKAEALTALHTRPLDGSLHTWLAREALASGDVEQALARATVATRLRPGLADAWVLLAAAQRELRDPQADASMQRALSLIHSQPDEAFIAYLLAAYPDPKQLGPLAPKGLWPWRFLMRGLQEVAPQHADALASARALQFPQDPEPLAWRSRLALAQGRFGLALHHARLLRQSAPLEASSHLAVYRATARDPKTTSEELLEIVDDALATPGLDDPKQRGQLEEVLVQILIRIGDDASLARASEILPVLVARPAAPKLRARRRALAAKLGSR